MRPEDIEAVYDSQAQGTAVLEQDQVDKLLHKFHVRQGTGSEVHLVPFWASTNALPDNTRLQTPVATLLVESCKREYLEVEVPRVYSCGQYVDVVTVKVLG